MRTAPRTAYDDYRKRGYALPKHRQAKAASSVALRERLLLLALFWLRTLPRHPELFGVLLRSG